MAKKKKKLRVAFRKNRQKKARDKNLTRQVFEDESETDDLLTGERISGKGELTRHRTVVGLEDDDAGGFRIDIDESKCRSGRVISAIGLNSLVQANDGKNYECTVRRVVRMMAREARNAVVTGDRVLFQPTGGDSGVIERVEPRQGTISRNSQRAEHVIVANVDSALIVVSAAEPDLKPGLIDRFLISAEKGNVRSIVCINKIDLVDRVNLQPIAGLYSRLGYDVVLTSAASGAGLARLRHLLKDRQTVFSGQSGVGKSSLLNQIESGFDLRTTEVSGWTGKGRHTTRRAVLLPLGFGGWVVDTPGIRQLSLWDVIPEEVEGFFVEFRPFVRHCRFPDCRHTHETDCCVKEAVTRGLISQLRYDSYCRIVT